MDEIRLMARIKEGDEDAFMELYRGTQAKIYRYAFQMTGSRLSAEETVQEVFLALIGNPGKYTESRGPLLSYLYGIARNVVRRLLHDRRRHGRNLVATADLETGALADTDTPFGTAAQKELVAGVRSAVLQLPRKYREVIVLCELQGLRYSDAAGILGCRVGTVRSRLHRGREILASKLRASPKVALHSPDRSQACKMGVKT